jgi:hypothetical protein
MTRRSVCPGACAFFFIAGALSGQWDSVASRSLVLGKLHQRERQPENPFCEHEGCKAQHQVLGEYDLPYKTRKAKLVVTASTDDQHNCHSCGAALSFFEFTQRGVAWTLTDSQFAAAEWGQFGGPYGQGLTIAALSDDIYAIFLAGGEIHQGFLVQSTRVMARIEKKLQRIAMIQTGEDDGGSSSPGALDWRATVTVDPRGAGLRDLIVTSSGIREGKKFREVERYKFNGSEYALAP